MKKIVITGHTKGIGQAIYNYFTADPTNIVIGFSRATGFNISNPANRLEIVKASIDADIFVNNAYNFCDDNQTCMLEEIHAMWKGLDKIIINMSSIAADTNNQDQYAVTKRKLDQFCIKNSHTLPHIINLKPGWVMVDRVKNKIRNNNSMTTVQLIEIMDFCLRSKVKIKGITFRVGP